jgi:hypothetical protein
MSAFRDHPSAFDVAYLAQVFDQPSEALSGFSFEPVGTGQVGDSYRVTLDWASSPTHVSNPLPASLIAKCPAGDTNSRETARTMHLYEIETQFYMRFGDSCGARAPKAYLSTYEAGRGDGVLLLEDMAPARQIAQMDGCSLEQLRLALNEAALLHQSHWGDASLHQHKWLTYSHEDERREFLAALVPAIYPEWRARYEGRLPSDILDMGAALVARFDAYMQPANRAWEEPVVLSHGDFRLDNMLFTDAEGRVVILDWQTVSAGAPMNDIAYCVSTSLGDPGVRAREEEALVAHYHAQLGAKAKGYALAQAWQDYRRAAFSGFIMALVSAMLVERTPRGDEMFATMAERSGWQALHLDALSLI